MPKKQVYRRKGGVPMLGVVGRFKKVAKKRKTGGASRIPGGASNLTAGASSLPGGASFLGGSLSKREGPRIFQGKQNTYYPAINRAERRHIDYRGVKHTHYTGGII